MKPRIGVLRERLPTANAIPVMDNREKIITARLATIYFHSRITGLNDMRKFDPQACMTIHDSNLALRCAILQEGRLRFTYEAGVLVQVRFLHGAILTPRSKLPSCKRNFAPAGGSWKLVPKADWPVSTKQWTSSKELNRQ